MIKAAPLVPASPRLEAALERMRQLHPVVIDLSLGRIERLLARLDHPERRLPPTVHVAGTNGKGSTVAFLRAFAEAAGYRVHVYTSPHLVRFNERIRLAGDLIGDDDLADILEEVERANAGDAITFFEVTTAAAFLAFSRVPADLLILEVGLGGRLDATNVIDAPVVSLLTRISLDHTQFLGPTLADIAGEKAGIVKAGHPAVAGRQADPLVEQVFADRAAALGAPLSLHGSDWSVAATDTGFRFQDATRHLDLPPPGLMGVHQVDNAGLAIAATAYLPFSIGEDAIRRGLAGVEWPARLQRLTRGPLADLLPPGWDLFLDGGHNDSAGEVLARQLAAWGADGRPLDLVFGMLGSKRPLDFLKPLAPYVRRLRAVAIPGEPNSVTAEDAATFAREAGMAAGSAVDVAGAVVELAALGREEAPARLLICGSLYLAGTVLAANS
ncbi:folylpolyglutamate synthase/dihydrofolate synthase family protein [Niveispirillum sp.]|uniref:bifunctional folylpolyglutamate synthase/dihydrofolate synthase n=1 Tax=Niveispirillum sp. TaxID=1917217 RepID=UPI001B442F54|nr:folylpolyglutamate synthase/dihydrofolate synthase family protein [Niveispirillum sp.]MBP7337857.1 bifunctional folylpolyglutamate synthase/dihydrofolate synthase [Niveispirillum sp.]